MTSLPRVLFLCLIDLVALGQNFRWTYYSGAVVTGTSNKCSLRMPSSSTDRTRLRPLVVSITCQTAICTYQIYRGGSVPTGSTGTVVKNRTANPTSTGLFYPASDSTGGTPMPAAEPLAIGKSVIDMSDYEILAGELITVEVSSGSSQELTQSWKWEQIP